MSDQEQEFKSWGESYNPGIERSDGAECPECGWDMHESTRELRTRVEQIIGFSTEIPAPTAAFLSRVPRIGIIIVECPQCFQKFWYYCTANGYKAMKTLCPNWPKD